MYSIIKSIENDVENDVVDASDDSPTAAVRCTMRTILESGFMEGEISLFKYSPVLDILILILLNRVTRGETSQEGSVKLRTNVSCQL